jgi:hypothetical protein
MSSKRETGHAVNVANFEALITFCTSYGSTFNPSKDALTIEKLKQQLTEANNVLQKTKTNKTAFDNATNARATAFKDLKPFATKVVNALAACGASSLVVADAKTANRKIQGVGAKKAKPKSTPDNPPLLEELEGASISTSQQSYDSMVDHFAKLIETVTQEAKYKPNETDLSITGLNTKLEKLKTANTDLLYGYTGWSNARIDRTVVLYDPITGLVQISAEVKKYVKSVFGASSPQFKQISGLEFSIIKDR